MKRVTRETWDACWRNKAGRCGIDPQMTPTATSTTLKDIQTRVRKSTVFHHESRDSYASPAAGHSSQVKSLPDDSRTR